MNAISDFIQRKIEQLNKKYYIERRMDAGQQRLTSTVERINRNICKMSLENIELSKEELQQILIKAPANTNNTFTYEASAKQFYIDGRPVEKLKTFAIEVII